ncbi:hypothetical protein [Sphingobacterium hungaricum]|uniref:Uncharacterized protein n=1 Tax=Sphingobacterium hungaricum TaxID=2082723 RepID=A0A928USL2_9SPHI|nr:hypothetical protein [Sphingobacterium hungaricum]MBE8712546.1 hypothetical protein [Sphingobacterium hungaricum]
MKKPIMRPLSKTTIKVKPQKELPVNERKPFDLIIGEIYYFPSGHRNVVECRLIEIYQEGERERITVEIDAQVQSLAGTLSLYPYEIGQTPEEALQNRIT